MNAPIDIKMPRTVSACHAEITRLHEQISELNEGDDVSTLKARIEELDGQNDALEKRVIELEEAENPDAVAAIDCFLDEVERPVGQLKFDVVHGPRADRAILGLFDAVGRSL